MEKQDIADTLLIGVNFTRGRDVGVLIVGRKNEKEVVKVINAFQGEEAWQLYRKLITKTEVKNG